MAQVVGHLSVAELRAGRRGGGDATRARHRPVIWLLAQGRTVTETARLTSFVPRWIEERLARAGAFGPSSLGGRVGGRRGEGPDAGRARGGSRERAKTPPDDGGVLSSSKAAAVMAAGLGLAEGAEQRGGQALRAIGWTIRRPRPRHARAATPDERAAFEKSSTTPSPRRPRAIPARRSRPSPPTRTASGSSRSGAASGRRVRAPRGERPVAVGHHRLEGLWIAAFVSPATGGGFRQLSTGIVPGATSRTSSRSSPARRASGATASSCSRSTTPAGTARPALAHAQAPPPRPPAAPGSGPGQAPQPRAPAGRDAVGPPRRAHRQPAPRQAMSR